MNNRLIVVASNEHTVNRSSNPFNKFTHADLAEERAAARNVEVEGAAGGPLEAVPVEALPEVHGEQDEEVGDGDRQVVHSGAPTDGDRTPLKEAEEIGLVVSPTTSTNGRPASSEGK